MGEAGFPGGSVVKNPHAVQETWIQSLVWEDPTCLGGTNPFYQLLDLSSRAQEPQQ